MTTVNFGHFNSLGSCQIFWIFWYNLLPCLVQKRKNNPFNKKKRHGVELLYIIPPDVVKTRLLGGHWFHLQTVFKNFEKTFPWKDFFESHCIFQAFRWGTSWVTWILNLKSNFKEWKGCYVCYNTLNDNWRGKWKMKKRNFTEWKLQRKIKSQVSKLIIKKTKA